MTDDEHVPRPLAICNASMHRQLWGIETFAGQAEFARPNKKTEASAKKEIKKILTNHEQQNFVIIQCCRSYCWPFNIWGSLFKWGN